MNIALVVAGGTGNRMGQDIPKQFLCVQDKPIIIYTLEALQHHPEIDAIQVVCIDGWQKMLAGYAKQFNITKLREIITGGATRYASISAGMHSLWNIAGADVVIVHDAVRPLVTAKALSDTIEVCKRYGNSMTVIPCADTMYSRTDANSTSENVDRSQLVRGQTPEAVTGRVMREIYAEAEKKGIQLDSISALQVALGRAIHFAQGSSRNIKLTTTEDIELFKALLQTKKDAWLK